MLVGLLRSNGSQKFTGTQKFWLHPRIAKPAEKRNIWAWLNTVFNRVDASRIEEVGPDRAAAEWLIRCGASVKWKGRENWHFDYNTLPDGRKYKIEEIDATESCIMTSGFKHLDGLEHVRSVKLHKCDYLYDSALSKLAYLKNTLQQLHISSCWNISDKGLLNLQDLNHLKYLYMWDLPGVKDSDECVKLLGVALPECDIHFKKLAK